LKDVIALPLLLALRLMTTSREDQLGADYSLNRAGAIFLSVFLSGKENSC
jgi:hypothetical protein